MVYIQQISTWYSKRDEATKSEKQSFSELLLHSENFIIPLFKLLYLNI